MKKITILSLLFFAFCLVNAQTEGLKTEVVDGKEYYLYPVEQGNTLYSISKKFNVSLQELITANPDAEKGISVGQNLRIPTNKEVKQENSTTAASTDEYVIHTSQKGETLYSISRLYGVSVKDLVKHNPDYENYLPLNANVKVPKNLIKPNTTDEVEPIEKLPQHPVASYKDSLIIHEVKKGETVYSITKQYEITEADLAKYNDMSIGLKKGQKLTIAVPRKKSIVSVRDLNLEPSTGPINTIKPISGALNVAVFAPFMFDDYRREKANCTTGDCPIYPPTERALNYLHGVQMAIDSLQRLGVSTNLYVYDTRRDSVTVSKILAKNEFQNMDIIFAPFFDNELPPVLAYARNHKTLVVNVVPQKEAVLNGNNNVVNSLPSTETQIEYLAKYLAASYSDANVVAVKNSPNRVDVALFDVFQKNHGKATTIASTSELTSKLVKDKKNFVVVPSKDLRYVSEFMTKMNGLSNSRALNGYDVTVVGLEDWLSFNNVDLNYYIKFNTMFATSSYVDYNSIDIKKFQIKFRKEFNYDPNRYTFASFEAVLFHTYLYAMAGRNFAQTYPRLKYSGMHINYDFSRKDDNSGFENHGITIIGFEDGKLIKKN